MCCGIFIWQTHKLSRGSHTNHFPPKYSVYVFTLRVLRGARLESSNPGSNQDQTRMCCLCLQCFCTLVDARTSRYESTHMLRFPTKWWKLRKACMRYKEYEVKVNVVDSRGKCCPSCLAHSTGFPTIVISKIDNAAHYSQTIVSFSGTNYKKKQKKSTRPVIVTELWRTVPFCSCHSLQRNVDMMRKNMLKTLLHSPLFEPYLIWNALLYMLGVTQYK